MGSVLPITLSLALLGLLPPILQLRATVRGTTLLGAWYWTIASWAAWELAWITNVLPIEASFQDQIWNAGALLSLCPPIAVLGAKRPGSRVWNAFVVVPLLLVFAWPALVSWIEQFPPARLQLETPILIGYWLVLLMGFGNYLGTRFSLSSLLFALSLGWLAWSLSKSPEQEQSLQPIGPTCLLILGGLMPLLLPSRPLDEKQGWNRVWRDFQDAFGLVWAKRVMDRINHTAHTENWPAKWEPQGLVWNEDVTDAQKEETIPRIDHTLRWLLRRFVDPEWIDERH